MFRRAARTRRDHTACQVTLKIIRERSGGSISLARIFLETLKTDRLQVARNSRVDTPRHGRRLLGRFAQYFHRVIAAKRRTPS